MLSKNISDSRVGALSGGLRSWIGALSFSPQEGVWEPSPPCCSSLADQRRDGGGHCPPDNVPCLWGGRFWSTWLAVVRDASVCVPSECGSDHSAYKDAERQGVGEDAGGEAERKAGAALGQGESGRGQDGAALPAGPSLPPAGALGVVWRAPGLRWKGTAHHRPL